MEPGAIADAVNSDVAEVMLDVRRIWLCSTLYYSIFDLVGRALLAVGRS